MQITHLSRGVITLASNGGCVDTDMGMAVIRTQIAALSALAVKAGIIEGTTAKDGTNIAEYAAYNEYGVPGKKKKWDIPPRPFIRGWVENHAAEINAAHERFFKQVAEGKLSAEQAMNRLGQFAESGIRKYIKSGNFEPNADSTIKRKGSSRPLIETGAMRNSVRYKVVGGNK